MTRPWCSPCHSHILRWLSFTLVEWVVITHVCSFGESLVFVVKTIIMRLMSRFRVWLRASSYFLAEIAFEEIECVILRTLFFTAWLLLVWVAAHFSHLTASQTRQSSRNLWLKKYGHWLNHWFTCCSTWFHGLVGILLMANICDLFELNWEIICITICKWLIVFCWFLWWTALSDFVYSFVHVLLSFSRGSAIILNLGHYGSDSSSLVKRWLIERVVRWWQRLLFVFSKILSHPLRNLSHRSLADGLIRRARLDLIDTTRLRLLLVIKWTLPFLEYSVVEKFCVDLGHLLRRTNIFDSHQILFDLGDDLQVAGVQIVLDSVHQPLFIASQATSSPAQTHATALVLFILWLDKLWT